MKKRMIRLAVLSVSIFFFSTNLMAQEAIEDIELDDDFDTPSAGDSGEIQESENQTMPTPAGATNDMEDFTPPIGADEYVVKEGDTLWDICQNVLGSPWYWQKVWALNPHIANPHWIHPGQIVYFRPGMSTGTMVGVESQAGMEGDLTAISADDLSDIPEIIDESEWGDVQSGGQYDIGEYMKNISGNAFSFFNYRRDGFVAKNELKYSAKIANSAAERIFLTKYDKMYLKPVNMKYFAIGQQLQIFRQENEITHPKTGKHIGYKVKVLGKAVVTEITGKVVSAKILESYDEIQRGDSVRPWKNPVKDLRPKRNSVALEGYIVEKLSDSILMAENQIVFVDKGIKDGIEEGNRFFVIRKSDPSGIYEHGFSKSDLPAEKIGELLVLSAGSQSAVTLVTRSLTDLFIGDKVVMEKNY